MNTGALIPIVAIGGGMIAWVISTWIRARYGYPITDDNGKTIHRIDPDGERKFHLLSSENERLTGQVSRLEERIAVLERIVTDPAHRIASQIDALR